METGYLNFHDEEHFSDFSLSLEQNLMEKPQDLLMHIVENDFDYMETHLDIANADNLWNNEHERIRDMEEMAISEIPTISKIDNIKEDFAKVLTDWQEHIGYLQATDMDEYMDIIGLNMNTSDKKNFYTSENVLQDDESIEVHEHSPLKIKQEDSEEQSLEKNRNIIKTEYSYQTLENTVESESYSNKEGNEKVGDKKMETEAKLPAKEPKHTKDQNKIKKNIPKYDSIGIDITANLLTKQKKKKKEKALMHSKDLETSVSSTASTNQLPVLEAGDVKSLLEQFEASENTSSYVPTKTNVKCEQDLSVKCTRIQQRTKQARITATKKSLAQVSSLHKHIKDALPKEMIENIKTSGRKKLISIIPAMPNAQSSGRSNGTRMQDAAATLSRNKLLKIVTNNTKSRTVDGGLVQLDHDYCSSTNSSISNSDSNSEYEKQSSDNEKLMPIKSEGQQLSHCYTSDIKQTYSLNLNKVSIKKEVLAESSSGEVSDKGEEKLGITKLNGIPANISIKVENESSNESVALKAESTNGFIKSENESAIGTTKLQNETKEFQKGTLPDQHIKNASSSSSASNCSVNQDKSTSSNNSTHEMKIRSALATSILQFQRDILNQAKGTQKAKQMVSVLKKPPNSQQLPVITTTANESIVTTTNSSNDKVQNIIVQDTETPVEREEERKPPRRKLNLAEYRSRREQNRSDNSRTNSPIQPMALVYVHHASTTTEPIKDDPENLIWSEREIVSVLKPKVDIDEEKARPKPLTCDVGIQTYETVFEFPPKSLVDIDERCEEQRDKPVRETSQRIYRKHRISSSSSRSRSRSKSKNRSRSRSRSRSSSSRSRSRKRSNTRHRRISHRRSSVSSSSSWSSRSRSRSNTRSSFSSGSRYSRSRSRSSRSRSRCSSRYSSCSRSSSRSNFGRSKWPGRRRRERRYRRSYDRHSRQRSSSSYRSYRDWRRSPSNSYRKYDWYDREKQRQVEERRVIYVGRLDEGITKADLRRRFEAFGPVVDISVHFREHGDNYGFVTFAYKNDAYEAVEHGNDDPSLPRYDLCFGGRRAFCKVKYADLDGVATSSPSSGHNMSMPQVSEDNTFDLLLKEAKAKLRKRKA